MSLLIVFLLLSACFFSFTTTASAQGWPAQYDGVMLQGFYWDGYSDSKWKKLEQQSEELSAYFDLIWIPQSGECAGGNQMGYMPLYYFRHNSSFGTETELRRMIQTFREKGLGTIADVVINHRDYYNGVKVNFPAETYNGVTYQMTSTDICRNDDGGSTLTWANSNGYNLSSNNDTGEDWGGARDLDHKSANVNKCVKAYLKFLINDLGYTGFRYDMVKGYSASFTADYNSASHPIFSVGECWDNSTTIKNWINGTKVDGIPTSAAFDFQFRYRVRDALHRNNWALLSGSSESAAGRPLIYDANYRRYSVTFVENHDTERRPGAEQDPLKTDTLAANAFMLAMPGTPCVFLKHWMAKKADLKRMIAARKVVGITNESNYSVLASEQLRYAVSTEGKNGTLVCVVGKTSQTFAAPAGFTKILSGTDYCYFISDALVAQWNERLADIEAEEAASQQQQEQFTPHTATIYVRDELSWNRMNFYIWDSNNNTQLNGNWPGKQITATKEVNGYTWYYQTFDINTAGYFVNIVFSTGSGSPQTVDVNEVSNDTYFIIKNTQAGGKYLVEVDEETTGISLTPDPSPKGEGSGCWYDLQGRRISLSPFLQEGLGEAVLPKGVYIKNGKKILIK